MRESMRRIRNNTGNVTTPARLFVAAVLGIALCGAGITRAEAVPVHYVFSPDASILFADGHLETITGDFTIDIEADTITGSQIVLDGLFPEKGLYDHFSYSADNGMNVFGGPGGLFLTFQGVLDGHARSIADARFLDFSNPPVIEMQTLTGEVLPTPIPAALPLFATGLAGLGLIGWRRKRKVALAAA